MNKLGLSLLILLIIAVAAIVIVVLTRKTSTRTIAKGTMIYDTYIGNGAVSASLSGLNGTLVPANDITITSVTITSEASDADRSVRLTYTYNAAGNTAIAVETPNNVITTGPITTEDASAIGLADIILPAGQTSVTSSLVRRIKSVDSPSMYLSVYVGSNRFNGITCYIDYTPNLPPK